MNCECFSDCGSYLLEGVDHWCWGRVKMSVEASCLCEFPIMVGKFESAFWAWKVCDLVVHCSGIGFCRCECDRVHWLCNVKKGLENWSEFPKGSIAMGINIILQSRRSPMTMLPVVVVPVILSVLFLRPIFLFSYF